MSPKSLIRMRGFSLVELSIASMLFLLVLGLTSKALTSGVKNYLSVRSEIELQQNAIVILSRMSRELGEANPTTTWPPPTINSSLTPTGGAPLGIVFSSPRDDAGNLILDGSTRRPVWQKRICYFFNSSTRQVLRAIDPLAAPSTTPPLIDPSRDTAWFQTNAAPDPFPGEIQDLQIEVGESLNSFNFDLKVSNSALGRTTTIQFLGHATMRGR